MSGREITPEPRIARMERNAFFRRKGDRVHPLRDLFHTLMTASWPATLGAVFAAYVAFNALFALFYVALGDKVDNARPGNFEDAFFFSIQTMATIGYGAMSPRGTLANIVVSIEAIAGIIAAALTTGLVFAKFSRPTARVRFAHCALVDRIDGKPVLTIRVANERANRIMAATAHVILLKNVVTKEGQNFRKMFDLRLQRETSTMFAFSWTIFHTIDESSPLHGETSESLGAQDGALIVSISGTDETLMQTVHARHVYEADSVVMGARFVDIIRATPEYREIDFSRLHTYVEVDDAESNLVDSRT